MTTPKTPGSPSAAPVGAQGIRREEKASALAALLDSGVVRERTCLHALLVYLGKNALGGGPESPKEYTIGVEALGKPPDYDPRLDPSVRVEIAKLRKRVREFYQGRGAAAPIHIDIPTGQYGMTFLRSAEQPARGARRATYRVLMTFALGGLFACGLLAGLRWRAAARPPLDPELAAFWAPFVGHSTPTLISYGTPLFLKVDRAFFRDPYLNREEDLERADDLLQIAPSLRSAKRRLVVNFTGVGEAEGLFAVTRLLASQGAVLSIQRSAHLSWEDMKGKHVILLGSHKFNAQIPELPVNPKFQAASRPSRVVNLHPGAGEPSEYLTVTAGSNGEILEEYAVVSVYRGFTANTRLMTLCCSSTEGTAAAAEYVTRADTLRELYRAMQLDPARRPLPPAFQVVVHASMKDGVPVRLAHVAHHVPPAP